MGDDTPIAVLSRQIRPIYDYFRQQFAQVTNPPIDSLRESIVMSLETRMGRELNVFEESPEHANRVILTSPLLSPVKFYNLLHLKKPDYESFHISLAYDPALGMEQAIKAVVVETENAVRAGKVLLFISERLPAKGQLMINALLATAAIHQNLNEKGT